MKKSILRKVVFKFFEYSIVSLATLYAVVLFIHIYFPLFSHIKIKKISVQQLQEVVQKENLFGKFITQKQLDLMQAMIEKGKPIEKNVFEFAMRDGQQLRDFLKSSFQLKSSDQDMDKYVILPSRNWITKNAEYWAYFSLEKNGKVKFWMEKFCCNSKLLSAINDHGWIKVE